MKKTLLIISVLACMAAAFTGCDANVNINMPEVTVKTEAPVNNSENSSAGSAEEAEVTAVTKESVSKMPGVSKITSVSEVKTAPEETAVTKAASSENKTDTSSDDNAAADKTVLQIVDDMKAPGSPLEKGYIDFGYNSIMSRYYDIEFNGPKSYSYTLNCKSINLGTAYFMKRSEGTVNELSGNLKSEDVENEYRRLISYINDKVGEGNYRFHDAYTENYTEEYGPDNNTVSESLTHVDIVLNSDLDKYTNAAEADKSKYIVRFQAKYGEKIISEYEFHSRTVDAVENLISDLYRIAPEYAYGVDNCFFHDYSNKITTVHEPFFNAVKLGLVNGEEEYFWLDQRRSATAVKEGDIPAESDIYNDIPITIYCRPETDTSSFTSVLEKIYPVTSEYGVSYINVDVLESESDFEKFAECDGYIPEKPVRVSCRTHYYNNPAFEWNVPGK